MAQNQHDDVLKSLEALKLELHFCEQGGYKPVAGRFPARASENDSMSVIPIHEYGQEATLKLRSIFRDSPSCLNYGLPVREHPCSECWLMNFVPVEKRNEAVPCHHIPLNERGDTVASLERGATASEVQKAVTKWLRGRIQKLEEALAQSHKQSVGGTP